jgi:hypothetical protein
MYPVKLIAPSVIRGDNYTFKYEDFIKMSESLTKQCVFNHYNNNRQYLQTSAHISGDEDFYAMEGDHLITTFNAINLDTAKQASITAGKWSITVSDDNGITLKNNQNITVKCDDTSIELTAGGTLKISSDGLFWNGKKVLTES